MMNAWVDWYRVKLQVECLGRQRLIVFTDSYKHMECLGGMRL